MCAERAVAYFKDQVRILSDTVVLAELSFLHVSLHRTKVRSGLETMVVCNYLYQLIQNLFLSISP
jgi:hypothetical protein